MQAIPSPAFQATSAGHQPPARGDGDARGGWQPGSCPRTGAGFGKMGKGGKSTEGRIIHGHSLSPFHCI